MVALRRLRDVRQRRWRRSGSTRGPPTICNRQMNTLVLLLRCKHVIYTRIYTRTHTHTYTNTQTDRHTHTHAHTCIHTRTHTHIHTYFNTCDIILHWHTWGPVCECVSKETYSYDKRDLLYGKRDLLTLAYLRSALRVRFKGSTLARPRHVWWLCGGRAPLILKKKIKDQKQKHAVSTI